MANIIGQVNAHSTMNLNSKEIETSIRKMAAMRVYVGIPDDATQRTDGTLSNAELGYIHEFGAPGANIPARPFLIPTIKAMQTQIKSMMQKIGEAAVSGGGNPPLVLQLLNALGLMMQNAIRSKLNSGPFEPLKPATLAARRRRGRSGTQPLIDTGQLRNSITYTIK